MTPKQQGIALNALRVAAEQYDRDAGTCLANNQSRLADQFTLQATEARQLAYELENDESYVPH